MEIIKKSGKKLQHPWSCAESVRFSAKIRYEHNNKVRIIE